MTVMGLIQMPSRTIGIIVHGATGRIASTQHLKNALTPIRAEGGLVVGEDRVVPQLILVGRDKERLAAIARENGGAPWTTDLDVALSDPDYTVLFDAAATHQRNATLEKGIAAGKHIYAEKPVALTAADGRALLAAMTASGLKHGAVEDKQYLPGLRKLRSLAQAGYCRHIVGNEKDSSSLLPSILHLVQALLLEIHVTHGQDLIDNDNVRLHMGRHSEG